ncbi:odorant receptor 67c-like [Ctenocephalides felis]|uniref:odorant receptor 67c-like n=1 Tax=Ctenocephalides felis TaxID=7515 RepID=UPI000E6E51AB|nr:odorant receptor 67c-like [Ctenocephalides felis]XP_026465503.1 odorant receptor 67c-like [Ctenocephalides felis]
MAAFATLSYLGCMLWQLFLYCWNGNELLIQSWKTAEAAYACNWYNCSATFCDALRLMMLRCSRPIKMTAGSFIDLSLQTYVTIVKASYSFFTVMNQNSK